MVLWLVAQLCAAWDCWSVERVMVLWVLRGPDGSQSLWVDLLDWDAIVCVVERSTDMRRKVVVGLWVPLIDLQRH